MKQLNRWHFSPLKLGKMFPQLGDPCWKCGYEGADLFHMWWGCPKVFRFWPLVGNFLLEIIGEQIPLSPKLMLLLDVKYFQLENYKMLLTNLLTVVSFH